MTATQKTNVLFSNDRRQAMAKSALAFKGNQIDKAKLDADLQPLWQFSNMDAADTLYFASQLTQIREGLYEVQYGKLKADRLVFINTSIDRGAEHYQVRAIDVSGTPVPMKGNESNLPTVKLSAKSATINFHSFGLGYDYSAQDAHAAAFAGMPLSPNLALRCRERQARHLDQLLLVGDPSKVTDIVGLFNQSGTLTFSIAADGQGNVKSFDQKNPDQIIRDLNAMLNTIVTTTFEVEEPDTLVLPVSTQTSIAQIRVGDGTSDTILSFFQKNRPEITIERSMYLETLGAGSTKRAVAYQNDPTRVEALVSVLFDQTAPQFNGYQVKTMTEIRTAGVALYLPESMNYSDGL